MSEYDVTGCVAGGAPQSAPWKAFIASGVYHVDESREWNWTSQSAVTDELGGATPTAPPAPHRTCTGRC